jgi:chromosome partitioning protein
MITVIANLKGGTGKSTVTFNLAVWLCSTGRRTTVIDLDPQRTLSDAAALRMEEGVEPSVRVEAGAFSDVTLPENAEEIIIDVGTADLGSFKQAIMIADRILIPVTPSQADIWSTQRFVAFLYKNTHGNPPESITFLNRADTNKTIQASDEAAAALDELPGVRLMPQRLSGRPVFRDSFSEGLAVFELEPRSIASREFKAFAETLFGRGYRSVIDRLRKQKTSTVEDSTFRQALETPSAKPSATDRIGYEDVIAASAAEKARENWGQEQQGSKKQKTKEGKKHKKASKEKQGGKGKSVKDRKKSKKTKKGRKGKKGA